MTHGTIEETYEHHLVSIIKSTLRGVADINDFKSGEELQEYLNSHRHNLAIALLDDIETWMGFDDLLEQVKND